MRAHFILMAEYNAWANLRLYDAVGALAPEAFAADVGVAFGSLSGTLNHLLVGDRIWMARFRGLPSPGLALDATLHERLADLRAARIAMDREILDFMRDCETESQFSYANSRGEQFSQRLGAALPHFFNHQTHHRGQCHAILTRLTGAAPALDLIYFQRETQAA